jgi:hypothetical protein
MSSERDLPTSVMRIPQTSASIMRAVVLFEQQSIGSLRRAAPAMFWWEAQRGRFFAAHQEEYGLSWVGRLHVRISYRPPLKG